MRSGRCISKRAQLFDRQFLSPTVCGHDAQSQTVVPARREVAHFDFIVACSLPLAPQQQALLRTQTLLVDVADCEAQNQGPYQTQYDLAVPVDDILGTNVGHLDAPPLDVVQRLVDIFEFLHAEFGFGSIAAERFVAQDFEEVDEGDLGQSVNQMLYMRVKRGAGVSGKKEG